MEIDWKVILAPFVGGAVGYAGAHWGLNLPAGWAEAATVTIAGLITAIAHVAHVNATSALVAAMAQPVAPPAPAPPAPKKPGQAGRASASTLVTLTALSLALTLAALPGCAALGLATPQTFNQKLAVGYGAATAVLTTTDSLLQAGKISSALAGNIESQDQTLKAALDIAATTYAANEADGGNLLATALTSLNALSTYLGTL